MIDGGTGYDRLNIFTNRAVSVSAIAGIEWILSNGAGRSQLTFTGTLLDLSGTALLGKIDIRAGTNADTILIGAFTGYNGSVIEVGLHGADGNDTLVGSNQGDLLSGGAGDDRLTGGIGNDNLSGGFGSDTAVFAGEQSDYSLVTDNGTVTIVDNAATVDGNDGNDTLIGIEIAEFKGGVQIGIGAPVVLDLNGDGVKLIKRMQSEATFDWDGSGARQRTGWVDANDGILVFDRNDDGTVSGANEISFTGDKPGAKSDLDGLTAFDSDSDGQLGTSDAKWGAFKIWQDANGNGLAENGELRSMADVGIASISLTKTAVNRTWTLGDNLTVNTGSFTRIDGTTDILGDVALAYDIGGTQRTQTVAKTAIGDPKADSLLDWQADMFGMPWAQFQSPDFGQHSFERVQLDPESSRVANLMVQALSTFGARGGIDDVSFKREAIASIEPLSILDRAECFGTQRNGHCLA